MSQHRIFGVIFSIALFVLTMHRANTTPQYNDFVNSYTYSEITAWATGTPVPYSTAFGPERESQCGIFYMTHHPLLASYIAVAFQYIGLPAGLPVQLGMALPVSILAYSITAIHLPLGILFTYLMGTALVQAPGYYQWLSYPLSDSWGFSVIFLAGVAALSRRWWALPVVAFLMAWCAINPIVFHVAAIAGVTIAAYGFSLKTPLVAVASILAYIVASVLHILQVWCHFNWNWASVWTDYFVGGGNNTNLMMRVSPLSWADRWKYFFELNNTFFMETALNKSGSWTEPGFWPVAIAICIVTLLYSLHIRALLALTVYTALFLSTAALVPGLLLPHLHYMPHYYIMYPMGFVMVAAVARKGN